MPQTPDRRLHVPRREEDACVRCTQEEKIGKIFDCLIGTTDDEGLASQVRWQIEETKKLRQTVYGNGHMGLTETVRWMKWVMTGLGLLAAKACYEYVKYEIAKGR